MEETNTKLNFLSGGGEMGKLIRSKDWSKTPLGSPDTWPQSLRTTVSLCIASNFPIDIVWGPHRVQIYNDGYWPITGDKHPASMGQDFKECWLSAWPVIGQAFEEASLGETRFLENQRIFIDRYGYLEETFFTFSFSPILDESGGVGGLFHPVTELTQQTLTERRLNILRAVNDSTVNAKTVAEASFLILECLKDFELDLPFVLMYSIAANGKEANLQGSVGVESDSPLAPARLTLQVEQSGSWPFTEAIKKGAGVPVEELAKIFGTFTCGSYPEPPNQALVFPVTLHGSSDNNFLLVAGVSSGRRLDEKYSMFYDLLTASITNALTKARAYEEERKKAEALAEIDKAKTIFFSNISHEFRTPLTLMLSPLEELLNKKNNNFSEIEKGNIEITHRNAIRLLKLVNTLLDFSRIESGRVKAMFSLVDIVVFTKNLASNFRSVIEKAGLKLIVKADSIIQPVYVDKQMWEKIVFNLLSNAFKYTWEGEITVELSAEKDFVLLKVRDTGVGIPEAEMPKMFERFHRVQNVTGRTYEGTGIGLSLIKELVQIHQGTINVESELNAGSVFTVKIPTGKKHLNEHHISTKEIDSDEVSSAIYLDEIETLLDSEKKEILKIAALTDKKTFPIILVVDDNADMREHISSILSNSFNVITANNGMDALHKIKETIPVLVLSDIMMPVMDGIGLLKEIKSNKATSNIPVIFLTARAGEESKIEGLDIGADDYLTKPFSAKELMARVRAQIKIVKLRQSLEGNLRNLFLEAPAIIGVLRGPQHVFELTNEMYLQLAGKADMLGKSVREVFPEMEGQGFFELLDTVYTTGVPFIGNEMPARLNKGNGGVKEVYLNFVYQPFYNSEEEIDGILMHGVDVTEQILARKKIEENENQLQNIFLNAPAAIAIFEGPEHKYVLANKAYEKLSNRKAADLLGKSMQVLFPELKGTGTLELFDKVLETGESFSTPEYALMLDLKNEGVLRQYYFNFSMEPLKNTAGEIYAVMAITYDITEQVESRKKIEESEKQEAFLLKFSDKLRAEPNVDAVANLALQMLSEHLTLDRCYIGVYQLAEDRGVFPYQVGNERVPPMPSCVCLSDFPDALRIAFDRTLMIDDVTKAEDLTDTDRQNLGALGLCALVAATLRHGEFNPLWSIVAVSASARCWTLSDVKLIEEVTERTWAAVERAKAEEGLLKSEEKYRTLFSSIDQGFTHCELIRNKEGKGVDLTILEVNPTYEKQTGVPKEMVIGKPLLQVFPSLDKWMATYAAVVDNQCPVVFENYFEDTDRWFAIKAYPLVKEKFAVLFSDITEGKQAEEKLRESENRFRTMADSSPVLIWTIEAGGTSSYYNKTFLDFLGVSQDEDISDWSKIVHPDDVESTFETINTAIAERRSYSLELRLFRADGQWRWVLAQGNPSLGANNEFLGFVGSSVDITEQKEAQQIIEESESYFRKLIDNVPAIIWITAPDGNCAYLNKNWYDYTGQTEAEAKGFGWLDATHPDDKVETGRTFLEANAQQKPFIGSYRLKVKNGGYRWAIDRGSPKYSDHGVYEGMIGTVVDVHEEKLAEEKIRDSEKQFSTLANNIQNLAWIADGEGWIYWYNQRWYDYTGTTLEEMEGWGWQKVHHPDHVERILEISKNLWKTNAPFELTFPLRRYDGEYRWFLTRGEPISDEYGNIISWIGTNTDIEDQKIQEERKDEFISIASHELKTPLTTAKAYLQMLELTLDKSNIEANLYAQKANESVVRLNELISELLDVSKIRLGKINYSVTTFNFNDMVDAIVENMQLISPTHSIIKTGKVSNDLTGDKDRLQQVLINLLTNAIKYSPGAEKVFVHVEQENDSIKVSVKDNGIGIAKKSLNKIFDKYHRIEEHAIQFQGLGIGLYISYDIIQRHQGKLWAESEPGKGSIFYFTLPVAHVESGI